MLCRVVDPAQREKKTRRKSSRMSHGGDSSHHPDDALDKDLNKSGDGESDDEDMTASQHSRYLTHLIRNAMQMFSFSQADSKALTNATRRHEYSRGLSRLLSVPGVLVSFLELRFLG